MEKFEIKNGVLVRFNNIDKETEIVIPSNVTRIGNYAFHDCAGLTSITIPDSVTSIGDKAFFGCAELEEIAIPNNVTSIGDLAFWGCSKLTEITIPDGVKRIGDQAFEACKRLADIKIPNSVTSIGRYAFYGCKNLISEKKYFKAFSTTRNGGLRCLNKYYSAVKTNRIKGDLKLCRNGIHFCTNLFEIFNYYSGEIDEDIAICEIEVGEKVLMSNTSKGCTNSCKLIKRLYREDILELLNAGGVPPRAEKQ